MNKINRMIWNQMKNLKKFQNKIRWLLEKLLIL